MVIDILLVVIVLGIMILETKRGFGKAVFDFIALLATVRVVPLIAPKLAESFHFLGEPQANEALCFAGVFVVVGVGLLFIGKLVYDATLITLDTFDPVLGGVMGIGVAAILGHMIARSLAIAASAGGVPPEALVNSNLGMEFYQFVTYHKVVMLLSSLTA